MLFPQLEEKLQASKQALNTATSDNIIEQCKQHLALLAEYRTQLYKLQDLPGVRQHSAPSLSGEVPDREAIRAAIETTIHERNRIQVLLLSFTTRLMARRQTLTKPSRTLFRTCALVLKSPD